MVEQVVAVPRYREMVMFVRRARAGGMDALEQLHSLVRIHMALEKRMRSLMIEEKDWQYLLPKKEC